LAPLGACLAAAALLAGTLLVPISTIDATAIYCYPGDPPAVYQACLAYNAGINQQVSNQQQLQAIQRQIQNTQAQINSLYQLINQIARQIAAPSALIAQTKLQIAQLDRQTRAKQAGLTRTQADVATRAHLLGQPTRF